jgi:hypothetical protein
MAKRIIPEVGAESGHPFVDIEPDGASRLFYLFCNGCFAGTW